MNDQINPITSEQPLVTVLFPVYNGAAYLGEAVQSILDQTYTNFEVIIINDGSKDESEAVINSFIDPRIQFHTQTNQGLAATLNKAVSMAKGKYLARQDQDDISLPQRFEKQVAFLETHPKHGMVGTWAEIWVGNNKTERVHRHPAENATLQFDLLFDNPFVHSSIMLRKKVFEKAGLYSTDITRQPPEDYELWSRIAREFEVANIPEILLVYREVPKSMSRTGLNPFLDRVINLSAENLAWITGREHTDPNVIDLAALAHVAYHRLSPRPRFQNIAHLFRDAVKKLYGSSNSDNGILKERAEARLRSIRHHYLEYRFGGSLGRIVAISDRARELMRLE